MIYAPSYGASARSPECSARSRDPRYMVCTGLVALADKVTGGECAVRVRPEQACGGSRARESWRNGIKMGR